MNDLDRFSGLLGEDYRLLQFAYPHHDEFQNAVAQQIRDYIISTRLQNAVVFEGGCGSGVSTFQILEACSQTTQVIAVDNEKTMLDQARVILKEHLKQVEFVQNDVLNELLERPSNSIDAFVAVWTLHNFKPDYRNQVFQEIQRVLNPGGLFISGDKYAVQDEEAHQRMLDEQLDRFREFAKMGNPELAEAWVNHNLEDEKIKMKEMEQCSKLQILGFKDIKTVYRKDMEAIISAIKS